MQIRQEQLADYVSVYQLIQEAFESASHADGNEQDLVVALRQDVAFIEELSLVTVEKGDIIGHIMLTQGQVGVETILVLAPLSVKPTYQGQGVGGALIGEAHRIAKDLGYKYITVLGDPSYYKKFGYLPASQFGIEAPQGIPPEYLMAINLWNDDKLFEGILEYPEAFGV